MGLTAQTGLTLTGNVRLLKAKASRHAIYGVLIAMGAIVLATLLVAQHVYGGLGLEQIVAAQVNSPVLWVLDTLPFVFAFWGQYVSTMIAYQAGAMVMDQTSELQAQTAALEHQAQRVITHDPLTDLPNRVLLCDRIGQAIAMAQAGNTHLAILLVGLNRFKEINNTLGHYSGDRLLRQVATRLQAVTGEHDSVARMGGDEFAILLPRAASPNEAAQAARKVLVALEPLFNLEGLTLSVDASMGIVLFPQHGGDADTLLQRANIAMYVAKQRKTGFVVYDSNLDQHSPQRLTLMGELRQGISQDQLLLHYQPKINSVTGKITEVEALMRWQHPRHGLMQPDDFIPLAERTGLIKPLTRWVLNQSLKKCQAWQRQGFDIGIAVNLSTQDLLDPEFPDTVAGLLASCEVEPAHLILEITESATLGEPVRALEVLRRLAAAGVRLAIDDFGTGYSSLSYLSKMPISEIKIDKSFVLGMADNDTDTKIVHATIDLAHALGLKVTAEGVEQETVFRKLCEMGCDGLQGFYVGYPQDADQFIKTNVARLRA